MRVATWEEHQGPLLSAIDVERGILNMLLFMIVGVAGFSILAIFTMIVSEKYRDIGIMKSLGASNRGVMSIFLGYGLLLGIVGCASGTVLGLWITEQHQRDRGVPDEADRQRGVPARRLLLQGNPDQRGPDERGRGELGAVTIAIAVQPAARVAGRPVAPGAGFAIRVR